MYKKFLTYIIMCTTFFKRQTTSTRTLYIQIIKDKTIKEIKNRSNYRFVPYYYDQLLSIISTICNFGMFVKTLV
jgi:hypothetical protein